MSLERRCHGKNTLEGERRLTGGRRKPRGVGTSRVRRHRARPLGHETWYRVTARGAVVPSTGDRRPLQRRRRGAPRAPGAAGGPPAAPLARRGGRPGAAARPRPAAAGPHRGRPALVGGALGTARHRQDHHRPPRRRRDQQGVRAAVGGHRRGEGRARGRRAGPRPPGRAGPRHDPLPRRGAPLQPDPAGRAAPARRGGAARAHRRDHREPVLLAHRPAAVALDAVPARGARRADDLRVAAAPCAHRRGARPRRRAPRRSTTTRSTHLADRAEGDARHALTSLEVAAALAAEVGRRRRSLSTTPRPRSRCARSATATTSTTTCSRRSSRASAAPTSTPVSTGSPACSRRGRTRA